MNLENEEKKRVRGTAIKKTKEKPHKTEDAGVMKKKMGRAN